MVVFVYYCIFLEKLILFNILIVIILVREVVIIELFEVFKEFFYSNDEEVLEFEFKVELKFEFKVELKFV